MVGLVLRKFYSPAKFRGTVRYGKNFSTETRKFLSLGREVVLYQRFYNFSKFHENSKKIRCEITIYCSQSRILTMVR